MKRLLAALLLVSAPLLAQTLPQRYSLATQVRPGFGATLAAEATTNLLGDTYCAVDARTFGRIAGNTTTTRKFWCQVGTGSVSAAPGWCALVSGDIPSLDVAKITTGVFPIVRGGTGTASTLVGLVRGSASAMTAAELSGDGTTSGSNVLTVTRAATLTTPRAINGVNFDGSTAITVTADANTLSNTTLHNTVVNSSLTSVGTLAGLSVAVAAGGVVKIADFMTPSMANGNKNYFAVGTASSSNNAFSFVYNHDSTAANRYFAIQPFEASIGSQLVLNANGNVGIGTTVFGTSSATVLGIGNGTAPSTSPANMVQMWAEDVSASSELRVRDEAGNVTTLSPHNFSMFTPDPSQAFPWSYYSKNAHIGKEMSVDMYGAIAEIEKLSGKKFIYTNDLPADQIEDWTAQEAAKKITVEKARMDKATAVEVEVVAKDALEVVAITKEQPSTTLTESVTKYVLDAKTGKVKTVTETKPKVETVATGNTETRTKAGVRLDEKTGRFWRHVRADEAVVEPYVPKAPPAWIADRMKAAK